MMSEEEKKKRQNHDNPHTISRREFALGTMAILGASSFAEATTLTPLSQEAQAIKLEIGDMVRARMETRHILDDDIKRVIDHAEKTGSKLYQPGNDFLLSKLRVKEVYFYVEYSPIEGGYEIHSAYAHRFLLTGDTGDQ
jgi:hypothetical protein